MLATFTGDEEQHRLLHDNIPNHDCFGLLCPLLTLFLAISLPPHIHVFRKPALLNSSSSFSDSFAKYRLDVWGESTRRLMLHV